MKITDVIKEFKNILLVFKNEHCSTFICCNTNNYEVKELFKEYGYYKNYMNGIVLYTPYSYAVEDIDKLIIKYKINFIKKEIISLNKLLKTGYTDI